MSKLRYLVYKATPDIGGGELVAGFVEEADASRYLDYLKERDRNGGGYYMKEYSEVISKEEYIVFRDKQTGRELLSYTARGTFRGEAEATADLLAYEKNIPREQIVISTEKR